MTAHLFGWFFCALLSVQSALPRPLGTVLLGLPVQLSLGRCLCCNIVSLSLTLCFGSQFPAPPAPQCLGTLSMGLADCLQFLLSGHFPAALLLLGADFCPHCRNKVTFSISCVTPEPSLPVVCCCCFPQAQHSALLSSRKWLWTWQLGILFSPN